MYRLQLLEERITIAQSLELGLKSGFYIGEGNKGKMSVWGERTSYEIAQKCRLWCADGSFKFTPDVQSDEQWIIHGVIQSNDLLYSYLILFSFVKNFCKYFRIIRNI